MSVTTDVGTVIEVTVAIAGVAQDISTATTKEIRFLKPSGATLVKTAVFTVAGADGKIEYAIIAGDIDEVGTWQYQGRVIMPSGEYATAKATFEVTSLIV